MDVINIEIKARCANPINIREILASRNADFRGVDHQTDTYFSVPSGRLKLREGNIENNLIFYERDDRGGPKKSECILYKPADIPVLKNILEKSLGIRKVVRKEREIWYLDNIKVHIDRLEGLGDFVEIEAKQEGELTEEDLYRQCQVLLDEFGLSGKDLVPGSYSDMV